MAGYRTDPISGIATSGDFPETILSSTAYSPKGGNKQQRVGELGLPEWVLQLIVFAVIAAVTAAIFVWLF